MEIRTAKYFPTSISRISLWYSIVVGTPETISCQANNIRIELIKDQYGITQNVDQMVRWVSTYKNK